MAKYKVQLTDILLDGEKLKEGDEVELTDKQTAGITQYLLPVAEEKKATTAKSTAKTEEAPSGENV